MNAYLDPDKEARLLRAELQHVRHESLMNYLAVCSARGKTRGWTIEMSDKAGEIIRVVDLREGIVQAALKWREAANLYQSDPMLGDKDLRTARCNLTAAVDAYLSGATVDPVHAHKEES